MTKLPEVEAAKELMREAAKWSVMKWLREKKRVRKTADQANAALDRRIVELKRRWPEEVRAAYELLGEGAAAKLNGRTRQLSSAKHGGASAIAQTLKDSHDRASAARMAAEQTFDDAERKLSTSLAREGCVKAIESWDLHERAISQSEKCIRNA
ncbi:MAG TPA: hypothetical protein VFA67_13515 [Candidatus Sulfotelmatobacter sp.]|nr:hypothetical protein [Candidatus Sulfotelmatobacter sp.]